MNLRNRKCPSCGERKDEAEFGGYITGARPCRTCERERVTCARWRRISLIKLRHEVEAEEKRLRQKKLILAERTENKP